MTGPWRSPQELADEQQAYAARHEAKLAQRQRERETRVEQARMQRAANGRDGLPADGYAGDEPPWPDETVAVTGAATNGHDGVVQFPRSGPGAAPEPARPDFRSAAVIAAPADVEDWHVEGVLRPGALLVVGGAEGVAKSQLLRELAIRAATGTGLLFGHYPIPRTLRSMVLDEENGESEEYRREELILAALRLERPSLTDYYRVSFAGMVLTDPAAQRWLDGQVETIRPDLLVLDTGTTMVGDEWGSELKAAMRYARSIAVRYGCSVVLLVHLTKPAKDRRPSDPAHGSALAHVMGQWTRSADSVALVADLGDDRLRWEMRKKVPPSTLILAKRAGIFEVVAVGEAPLAAIDATACGHSCIRDHEIVNLAAPYADTSHPGHPHERIGHLQGCHICLYVFDGRAADAARRRHEAISARHPFGVVYDMGKVERGQPTAGVEGTPS